MCKIYQDIVEIFLLNQHLFVIFDDYNNKFDRLQGVIMNVRQFKLPKIVLLLIGIAIIVAALIFLPEKPDKNEDFVSKSGLFFDTLVTITLYNTEDTALIEECFAMCKTYEKIFSRTKKNSELFQINENHGGKASAELLHVLNTGLTFCERSGGAFDITLGTISDLYSFSPDQPEIPSKEVLREALEHTGYEAVQIQDTTVSVSDPLVKIDLGAVAKGYIADRLKEYLETNGVTSGIINLGGNVLCIGKKNDGENFKIGIQYPFREASDTIAELSIDDLSVVTTGVYERYFYQGDKLYHHVLNPENGLPYDNGIFSVTIIGTNSELCDVLSTAAFTMGLSGMELIDQTEGVWGIYVTENNQLLFSEGAEAFVVH